MEESEQIPLPEEKANREWEKPKPMEKKKVSTKT